MKRPVTIKDIASRLGVSPSTVSRALNEHPDISKGTRNKIKALAESLDYQPDHIAKNLKTMKSTTLGVIIPEIKHDFFSSVLDGIDDVAHETGYNILVCKSNEDFERELINTRVLSANRIAGLLVSLSQSTHSIDHFKALKNRNIPVVFFDRVPEHYPCSKVVVDDEEGAFNAVEYLIRSGCRRIAHIAGPQHLAIGRLRFEGYCRALATYGIPLDMDIVQQGGLHEIDGTTAIKLLLQKNIDAVFAINDPVAIGAMLHIKEKGIRIPEQISLVGFSDNIIASIIDPPLTTVAQPAYEIGAEAAKLILEEIGKSPLQQQVVTKTLRTRLVIRQTTINRIS